MHYSIRIEPSAQKDIEQAYDNYFSKGVHVADLFFDDLQHAYQVLTINPFFQIRNKNYRALPLKSFPYIAFFIIEEEKNLLKLLPCLIPIRILINTHD